MGLVITISNKNNLVNKPIRELYECKVCHKRFDTLEKAIIHGNEIKIETKTWFVCDICGDEFQTLKETRKHKHWQIEPSISKRKREYYMKLDGITHISTKI